MKRYIEVIFDDSGSMLGVHNSGKRLHEVAKELFSQTVLPLISHPEDTVALRLLRAGDYPCERQARNLSSKRLFVGDPIGLDSAVKAIQPYKSTPLYLTIRDAFDECKRQKATAQFSEFKIFVLTDGGDTCFYDFFDVVDQNEINEWNIEFPLIEPVLVQFNVTSNITRNNLWKTIRLLRGRSVSVNDDSPASVAAVNRTLRKSGFMKNGLVGHCFDSEPDAPALSWAELEKERIYFHQAKLLSEAKLLSFQPDLNKPVAHNHAVELRFLHAMAFVSSIPLLIIRTMIAQLERPLLFTHDCIRWDFSQGKWVYIESEEPIYFIEDESVHEADRQEPLALQDGDVLPKFALEQSAGRSYDADTIYEVIEMVDGFVLQKTSSTNSKGSKAKLYQGRHVKFERR